MKYLTQVTKQNTNNFVLSQSFRSWDTSALIKEEGTLN